MWLIAFENTCELNLSLVEFYSNWFNFYISLSHIHLSQSEKKLNPNWFEKF